MKRDHKAQPAKSPATTPAAPRDAKGLRSALPGKSLDDQRALLRPGNAGIDAQKAAVAPPKGPAAAAAPEKHPPSETDAPQAAAQATEHRAQATEAANGLLDELSGWADFAMTTLKHIQLDGMLDRAAEVSRAVAAVKDGMDADDLDIDPNDQRLRNVAEMQEVIEAQRGHKGQLAADGLRDANASFYVLLGNNAGRFDGMDMERYRRIGAMNIDAAAKVLPEFEADLFEQQTDKETIDFGNSLSAKHRGDLFSAYNATMGLVHKGADAMNALGEAGRKAGAWVRELAGL